MVQSIVLCTQDERNVNIMRRTLIAATAFAALGLTACGSGGLGGSGDSTRTASFEAKTASGTDSTVLLPFTVTVKLGGATKVDENYTTTDRQGKKTVPLSAAGCSSEAQTMIPLSITAHNDAKAGYAHMDPDIDILDAEGNIVTRTSNKEVRIAWLIENGQFSCGSTADGSIEETNMSSDPLPKQTPSPKIQGVILLPGSASDFKGWQLAITAGREGTATNIKGADAYASRGIKTSLTG